MLSAYLAQQIPLERLKVYNPSMDGNKKWEGTLDITFKKSVRDIFYYDVKISFGRKKVTFILPRYHPMVGWIEVFGLPPQNEWVFLDNEKKSWKKKSPFIFEVNGKQHVMNELLEVFPDFAHSRRSLELIRTLGSETETQWYEEDWSKMEKEKKIIKRSVFKHSKGHYFVDEEAFFNPAIRLLTENQKKFIETIQKKHGTPNLGIWLKRSTMKGEYPRMYAKLFPFWGKDILNAKFVECIELGYEVAQAHGSWYKLFEIAGSVYEVEEGNYSERVELYKGKKTKIKNTYSKKIRKIK